MRTRRAGFCAFGLAFLTLMAGPAELPPEKEKWFEARSAHFSFVTDGGEREVLEQSRSLETLYEVLKVISPDLQKRKFQPRVQMPSHVYMFSSDKEFTSYSQLRGIEGFFVTHPDGYYMSVASGRDNATGVVYHEYLHQFLQVNFPGVPPWLNEGLACFFQTMQMDGKEVRLGGPPEGYLYQLQSAGLMPVSRLLAVTPTSPDYTTDPARGQFYASTWLLTHYLMTGDEAGRAQLGTYLDLIRAGRSPEESFQRGFGRTPASLDQELRFYLNLMRARKTIKTWILQFKTLTIDPAFSYRALPRPEALGRLGLLLVTGDQAFRDRGRKHFDAALALDPHSATGNLGRGLLAMEENHPAELGPCFAAAVQGDPDDAMLQYFAGVGIMQTAYEKKATPDELQADRAQARGHLLRSVALGCPYPDALQQLAALVLGDEHPSTEELGQLEEACRRLPGFFHLKLNLAILYARASQLPLARLRLGEVAAQTADPELAQRAAGMLQSLDNQEADRLGRKANDAFQQKNYGEAVAALEEAIRLATDARLQMDLQEALKNMKILIELRTKTRR